MTTDTVSVREHTPFKDLVELLSAHRVSALPVVDREERVIGVVSEADLLHKEEYKAQRFGDGYRPELRTRLRRRLADRASGLDKAMGDFADELMSTPAITITPASTVVAAARLMARHDVKWLPVVDEDGGLVGVVARRDLLSVFVRDDGEIADSVRRELDSRLVWLNPGEIGVTVEDGVVTLSGAVEQRTYRDVLVELVQRLDGVVDVRDDLTWAVDDTAGHRSLW